MFLICLQLFKPESICKVSLVLCGGGGEYRQLQVLLQRNGYMDNCKLIYQIDEDE